MGDTIVPDAPPSKRMVFGSKWPNLSYWGGYAFLASFLFSPNFCLVFNPGNGILFNNATLFKLHYIIQINTILFNLTLYYSNNAIILKSPIFGMMDRILDKLLHYHPPKSHFSLLTALLYSN